MLIWLFSAFHFHSNARSHVRYRVQVFIPLSLPFLEQACACCCFFLLFIFIYISPDGAHWRRLTPSTLLAKLSEYQSAAGEQASHQSWLFRRLMCRS